MLGQDEVVQPLEGAGASGGEVRLHTARLLLREWRDEDRAPFALMNRDPKVMEHFPGLMDRAASDACVDRLQVLHASRGYTQWVVEVVTSDRGATPFAGFTGQSSMALDNRADASIVRPTLRPRGAPG